MVRVLANIVEVWKVERVCVSTRGRRAGERERERRAPLCLPPARMHFCELAARESFAKLEFGSTVPRKMDLYWFMPALAKRRVGSS